MTNANNPALASLARRLVIAELAARGANDPAAVETLVAPRLRLDDSGDFVALGHGGSVLPGILLSDILDDVQKSHPSLFKSNIPADNGKGKGNDGSNPFASGNVTQQMLLWRSDPEKAEYLAAEVGITIKPIR